MANECILHYHQSMKPRILDAAVLVIYLLLTMLSFGLMVPSDGEYLRVQADRKEYVFSLKEDGIHSFHGPLGDTVIEIKDSRARIIDSPCPNKTCIKASWSDTLVCLPNKVMAIRESSEEVEIDGRTG